jgi:DNA helicase HerA-like ATPase
MELLEIRRKFAVLLVGITHDPADVEVFEDGRVREVSRRRRDAAHSDCLRHHEVLQAA